MTLNIATNVKCPQCERKLCKLRKYGERLLIEFKHKGAMVLAEDAVVMCIDCKRTFEVIASDSSIKEVDIE